MEFIKFFLIRSQSHVFMIQMYKLYENSEGKGDITHNIHIFPAMFLAILENKDLFVVFYKIIALFSVWKSLKSVVGIV